jgi:hypothetical protein
MLSETNRVILPINTEAAETGDDGPNLEDVISMLTEDVISESLLSSLSAAASSGRRHRALHEARVNHASTSHSPLKAKRNARGHRALRKTHPSSASLHRRAPRAHHFRYNSFTRPKRRLQLDVVTSALLDSLSITGGYDGSQIFFKLEMDVSKEVVKDLNEIILKPLRLLSEADFLSDLNLFSGGSSETSFHLESDISFSASAHLGATGKCYSYIDLYSQHFSKTLIYISSYYTSGIRN